MNNRETMGADSRELQMGDTSTPAIRKARKASASISAAQTITVGERVAGIDIGLAGTGAAGMIRMTTLQTRYEKKAPDLPGP